MRFRVSVVGVLWYTLVAAVGMAALANASRAWYGAIFLLFLGSLGYAPVAALLTRGGRRRFWLGYAAFGWAFFVYCFFESTDLMVGHPVSNLASDASDWVLERFRPEFEGELPAPASRRPQPPAMLAQMFRLHAEKVLLVLLGFAFATSGAVACTALLAPGDGDRPPA